MSEFDELKARLPAAAELPARVVHPRVLLLPNSDTAASNAADGPSVAFAFVIWKPPSVEPERRAAALHLELLPIVEAALLSELSRPGSSVLDVPLCALHLLSFAHMSVVDLQRASSAFGFRTAEASPALLALARGEAARAGLRPPDEPTWTGRAQVERNEFAERVETHLMRLEDEAFGARPGVPFARLNDALVAAGAAALPPKMESLDVLEAQLVPDGHEVVRWIPPLTFQAICDAVGVITSRHLQREVQWAHCESDDGMAPPPMLRIAGADGFIHVEVGRELMRWCVMPVAAEDDIPSLAKWLRGRLT